MARRPRPGEQLRKAVLDRYELDAHEVTLLDSAADTVNIVAALQALVDAEGEVTGDGRPHPALVELRLQRLTLLEARRSTAHYRRRHLRLVPTARSDLDPDRPGRSATTS